MASAGKPGAGAPTPRRSPLARLRALPNDSPAKTILVALAVSLVGSILVAGSAVLLKPRQEANRQAEREMHFRSIITRLPGPGERALATVAAEVTARAVDLATGDYAPAIDLRRFDQRRAARDPARSVAIPAGRDLAQIKRRARHAVVYLVRRQGRRRLVVLPVHGRGFGSTLYGYLGLSGDTATVVGLTFYQHGETPGLGAMIDAPAWRDQWQGKKVWGADGKPLLGVARGPIDAKSPAARHEVDGLTGATWTGQGVTNLLRFWLGDDGFGPYLRKLRRQRG